MDIKEIKAIVDLMKKNSMTEFEMEKGDFKIRLQRDASSGKRVPTPEPMIVQAPAVAQTTAVPVLATPATVPAATKTGSAPMATGDTEVKSPMIGTFYRRPSPDADPYAEIGTQVEPDTVVCIIEAMKVMNEIKAEASGVITEILIEDTKSVEYGQVLFRIEPN